MLVFFLLYINIVIEAGTRTRLEMQPTGRAEKCGWQWQWLLKFESVTRQSLKHRKTPPVWRSYKMIYIEGINSIIIDFISPPIIAPLIKKTIVGLVIMYILCKKLIKLSQPLTLHFFFHYFLFLFWIYLSIPSINSPLRFSFCRHHFSSFSRSNFGLFINIVFFSPLSKLYLLPITPIEIIRILEFILQIYVIVSSLKLGQFLLKEGT